MNRVIVGGGVRLAGEVTVGGSKNAALPLLFGGILTGETCVFRGLPRVSDVLCALEILRALGAGIRFFESGEVSVNYSTVECRMAPAALTARIRGSTYLLGAMLGRFGKAFLAGAGGCDFGTRPIDQHLLGFRALGAVVEECGGGALSLRAEEGLFGGRVQLAMPSVGATANVMLAAVLATGETVIENAAAEPHVAALAEFLSLSGANIAGVGTGTVRIQGVPRLHGGTHRVIPDMIEAGTYLCMGVACHGPVTVKGVVPEHLGALLSAFAEMGVQVGKECDSITVEAPFKYRNTVVKTGPYPAFPTDLHPQMTALFAPDSRAEGVGIIREKIWESRFRYVEGLRLLGADISVEGDTATVRPAPLSGGRVTAPDLRGGAALLLAALAATGESEILGAAAIARGYEHLEDKLLSLGARVRIL